jgi:DNA-binding transcriptional LysR family regulator
MLMQATTRHWRAFAAVYRRGSMTAAALDLHLTQSAVSLLIRDLEAATGVMLFERAHRSVRPTVAADDLAPAVEHMLAEIARFDFIVKEKSNENKALLTIAVVPSIGTSIMPGILAKFAPRFPAVKVVVHERWPQEATQLVAERSVEFAIGTFDPSADVDLETLAAYSLIVLCRPDSPLAKRKSIIWADVYQQPIISLIPAGLVPSWIGETLAGGRKPFRPAFEVSKIISAIAMVHENLGCTVVPSYLANDPSAAGLVKLPVDEPANRKPLAIMIPKGTALSPAARFLAELVREEILARVEPWNITANEMERASS